MATGYEGDESVSWSELARARAQSGAALPFDSYLARRKGPGYASTMGEAAAARFMSASEFLKWERAQTERHEYKVGEVFAMAGGSPRHNGLSGRVIGELYAALRGKGCHVLSSDQRVSAKAGERYVYPDAVVVCGAMQTEPDTSDVLANPTVIVEVLSQSTESYDRGEKWGAYQRLESLTDYLLVSQGSTRIEHFRREDDGSWKYRVCEVGDSVVLANTATLSVDAIYEGVFDLAAG